MKEKRYFCDFWFGPSEPFKRLFSILWIATLIILVIASVVSYCFMSLNYRNELESYSESTYQHLNEIADNIISKEQGIDLSAIPEDVAEYEILKKDDRIIFKYSLDNNKGMQFAGPARMELELSEDFEIISSQTNYVSEQRYVRDVKLVMAFASFCIGALSWIIIFIAAILGCTIAAFISKANKKKDRIYS